jgi:hypothetical protein
MALRDEIIRTFKNYPYIDKLTVRTELVEVQLLDVPLKL